MMGQPLLNLRADLIALCVEAGLIDDPGMYGGPDDSRSLLLMVIYPTVPII